jgi:hypothetical protein
VLFLQGVDEFDVLLLCVLLGLASEVSPGIVFVFALEVKSTRSVSRDVADSGLLEKTVQLETPLLGQP